MCYIFLSECFFRHLVPRVWITKVLLYKKCMYACMYVHTLTTNIPMYRHTYTYICMYVHISTYTHAIHTWYIRTHTKLSYSSSDFWHLYITSSISCLTLFSSLSNWLLLCYKTHPVNNIKMCYKTHPVNNIKMYNHY